jgi:hypothetical protein
LKRIGNPLGVEARLKRLAQNIAGLEEKDNEEIRRAAELGILRRRAAAELHGICRDFVHAVADYLPDPNALRLDPQDFSEDDFSEYGTHLFQLSIRGRILQIEFAPTSELLCDDDYRVPYTLAGSIRAFNQRMLENACIDENQIFFTVEQERSCWIFFDRRTHRATEFSQERLLATMESLI